MNSRAEIFQNVMRNMFNTISNTAESMQTAMSNVSADMERVFPPAAQARPPAPQFSQLPFEQQLARIQAETRLQESIHNQAERFENVMNNAFASVSEAFENAVTNAFADAFADANVEEQNDDANGEEQNMNRE